MDRGLQEIVDSLSLSLGRPVLIDDAELRPLAYSTQFGELDAVRTASILGRLAPDEARVALFAEGIRTATAPVHIPARPDIGMRARVCIPLVGAGRRLGYLWLFEDPPVTAEELRQARAAAAEAAALVGPDADAQLVRRRHEQQLVTALLGDDPEAAAHELDEAHYLPLRPVRVWVAAPAGPAGEEWSAEALDRLRARLAAKQALCAELEQRLVCLAGERGSAAVLEALGALTSPRALIGQGDAVEHLRDAGTSYRRALAALRVAAHEESGTASWDALGVERVVTALPDAALEDLPEGLRKLLAGDQSLVRTLEAYLDHAGDVKRTAAALSLHRGGLYYRLRRIEDVAGVNLHDGEDRLLCHLALRLARLSS
ncbi:helix-turn-helix domain-containing protein [Solirubrobacter sp. CPCC 204708]|uniref:Helix-turn-helix domain-containing protein n=1 Tax=Solirubrobacter deserti TaxID=2282478 RepID=A0ABT4RPI3_9ACTN|nr:PucR family transcriptional regulator [Solirubrobacter deserti]MBE2319928.1 helix-turn-helix domain-containing protein [Solirubrobacter deserti]MDA0140478.1 helix-turn-helix domain-containing protein [Solirubrobacter deserti]